MLMYNIPKKGVYACPVTKEGKIKIPKGTWEIYDCAFQRCEKIEEVVIPASVRWVGDAAFGYSTGCRKISVGKDSKYLKSVDGVLYTKDGKVSAEGKVTFIMKSAYENCPKLEFKNCPKKKKYSNTWDVALVETNGRTSWESNYKYLAYMETEYRWKAMYHYLGGE